MTSIPLTNYYEELEEYYKLKNKYMLLKQKKINELIGEYGKESVRALNYNVFTNAVKATQELSDIVKQQQIQIDLQQQQINKLLGL
jgi:ATP-dependent Lon protease